MLERSHQEVGGGGLTTETFTSDEARALAPYFSNIDRPVFALMNLPETVKGALFARYSRSAKPLRRLFLDEFLGDVVDDSNPRDQSPRLRRSAEALAEAEGGSHGSPT